MKSRSSRVHVRMSKAGTLCLGWHPPRNLLEWTCCAPKKTGTPTQSITTIESRLPWCDTLEKGLLLCRSTECTIDHTGHVLHARTDRNVYVNHHSPLFCVCLTRPCTFVCMAQAILSEDKSPDLQPCCRMEKCVYRIGHQAAYARCAAARAQ